MLFRRHIFYFPYICMNYYGIYKVRDGKFIKIFYRITEENKDPIVLITCAMVRGNKRANLNLALLKTGRTIGIVTNSEKKYLPVKGWKNLTEKEFIGYLKKGKLSEVARKVLFKIFGNKYFGLTRFERDYFTKNFATPERLVAFYKKVQKEKRMSNSSYDYKGGEVTRDFNGKPIIITSTKIRKASRELFGVELDDIIKVT